MPDHRSQPEGPRTASRRGFLLVLAGAVVAAGGGGVAAALRHSDPNEAATPGVVPAALLTALQAESHLIASIDAMGAPVSLAHVRADHVQHRQAIAAAIAQTAGAPVATPSAAPAAPITVAQLLTAEQAAAAAAARAASQLVGAHAALLASISACEASHAELLR